MTSFPEEQLDSPVGYFPAQPGQLLKDGVWTIVRKLGWGSRSSTWLAFDNQESVGQYRAIKILTAAATEDSKANNERNVLSGPVKNLNSQITGVPELISHFYEKDAKGKRHLCLVFRPLGSSVEDLRRTNIYDGEYLPIHTVQKVIGDIVTRLVNLHGQKVIHGALTADNFLFWTVEESHRLKAKLTKSPRETAEKIVGSDGVSYPSVRSQPIEHGNPWDSSAEDIMNVEIYLCNYGHASQVASFMTSDSRNTYLPPEVVLGKKFGFEGDIWMLGCTTYLLLTGGPLFSDSYIASPIETAKETIGKLASLLKESEKLAEKDIPTTVSFLKSCLAIKPKDRASAMEVINGGWITCGYSDYVIRP